MSTPAIILNSSPPPRLDPLALPNVSLPGSFFASAIRSATDFTGRSLRTSTTCGLFTMPLTGSSCFTGSY